MQAFILLVEDHPIDIELAQTAIDRCELPHDTVVVRDGQEALDFLSRRGKYADRSGGNPDAILLDLKMPGLDGFDVLKSIRATPSLAQLPVIALSASSQECDIARARQLQVTEYLVKPIE